MVDGAKRGTFDRLLGTRATLGTVNFKINIKIKIHLWPM